MISRTRNLSKILPGFYNTYSIEDSIDHDQQLNRKINWKLKQISKSNHAERNKHFLILLQSKYRYLFLSTSYLKNRAFYFDNPTAFIARGPQKFTFNFFKINFLLVVHNNSVVSSPCLRIPIIAIWATIFMQNFATNKLLQTVHQ